MSCYLSLNYLLDVNHVTICDKCSRILPTIPNSKFVCLRVFHSD